MSEESKLREQAKQKAEQLLSVVGHPVQVLKLENQAILRCVNNLREQQPEQAEDGKQKLEIIKKHYVKKQDLIYPVLEASYEISGPSRVLWAEDDRIRGQIRHLSLDKIPALLDAIEAMVNKEEVVLIPMCVQYFTMEQWYEIYRDLSGYNYGCGTSYPVWQKAEVWLKEQARESRCQLCPESEDPMQEIQLSTGHLSLSHLDALLKTIPIEMTFVDETDTNRLFTSGGTGFKRSLSAMDRNVMTCHPPKAVNAVEKIIASFRSGEKDMVEYKLPKGNKILKIQYIAVRDDDGTYLGTLECVRELDF